MDQKGKRDEQICKSEEDKEEESFVGMENKEKAIEATDMSIEEETLREEEHEVKEKEEPMEKERNGFDGMKINEKRKEIKMMKEEIAEEGEREKDKREESDSFAPIEEKENEMDRKGAQSKNDRKEVQKNGEMEEEKEEEDDSSIVTIPAWIFEEPNSQQDDVTRGASCSSSTEVKMEPPRCSSWHPWFFVGLGWLPIMVGLLLCLSIVIPYCIAVGLRHVSPGFPYISDSGTIPPESCIFGQLLNMAAGLGFAGIYVRYKQVEFFSEDYGSRRKRMLQVNKIGLILGVTACFGMSVVANFQIGNVKAVHFTGAFLLFAPGALYGFFQSWLSYQMHPQHASILVCHVRLFLSVIIALFFASCMLFTLLAQEMTIVKKLNLFWVPADGGFSEHIVATVSEWVVAIAFLLYFFTFIREFQKITLHTEIKHHLAYDALVDTNSYPPVANYDNSYSGSL